MLSRRDALLGASSLFFGCASTVDARRFEAPLPAHRQSARLIVLGDVQRTSKLEVGREHNPKERARILRGVAAADPDLVAFTGDLVFDGGSDEHWAEFDRLTLPLRDRNIPAITALGNHEYWLNQRRGPSHVFERFPIVASRRWYSIELGPLLLVVLDSNRSKLSKEEWQTQRHWYERTLETADGSKRTRGILVLLHHPPYTNSTVTHDESQVEDAFVPAFMERKRTLAMLSGHVHSYERFVHKGKTFVVSGGGGGPRHKLAVGDERRHPDDLFHGPAIRDFHFTIYTLTPSGIDAEVRALPKGGTEFHSMCQFSLKYPEPRGE